MWAFQRRGLAMDNCRLLDWNVHEAWLQYMLNAMTRDCPSGYHAVRSEQLIKADCELWTILAQEDKDSLKPQNDVPALNAPFKALTTDPRVTMFLLPVPSSSPKPSAPVSQTGASKVKSGTVTKGSCSNRQQEAKADKGTEKLPSGAQGL